MNPINRRSWLSVATSFVLSACALSLAVGPVMAAKPVKKVTNLDLTPVINSVSVVDGKLVASGVATVLVKGQTVTSTFTAPVDIKLAADQTGAGACPILDLSLGPINLDLLGLIVETSPICLQITAYDGGGLLGDLLCNVANLLNGGLSLSQILAGGSISDPLSGVVLVPAINVGDLLSGLTDLLNAALSDSIGGLLQSVLTSILSGGSCGILHLELGPLDLTLLGLEVTLDDCNSGPVVVDVSGQTGRGKLLGNLLCELLDGGLLNLGSTLQQILNQLTALLTM